MRTVWEQAVLDVLAPTGVILMACVPVDDPAKTKVRGSSLTMQRMCDQEGAEGVAWP